MGKTALQTAPEKPKFGQPCNGCGFCCASEVCEIGLGIFGKDTPAPCPAMTFKRGRFECGAVNAADKMGPAEGLYLRLRLGIGLGCDSDD